MQRVVTALIGIVAGLLIAGCASGPLAGYDIPPGTNRDAVLARMGAPTRAVRIPGGERLLYSLQPIGRQAWAVDLDAAGRVTHSGQVLTATNFNRIQPGWTRDDVEREFGPPAWIERVASWNGPLMTYRWRDTANADMFFWVYLDERNVVQRAHPGMEFINGPNDKN